MPPSPQTITNNSNPLPTTANGGAAAPKKLTYLQELVLGLHNGPPRTAALAGDSQFNLATLVLPV
ncbi:MAG: hypothetical protein U0984_17890 [Prosthecobacter sp.]|nr:hypothetical protein [Prosthecobacter sp.]